MKINIIAAVADNGVIGHNGKIPWHLPEDLKRFKRLTTGCAVIMGRKTWESLGSQLTGREVIVISCNRSLSALYNANFQGFPDSVCIDLELALGRAKAHGFKDVFIAGGNSVYKGALPLAHRMFITRVHSSPDGDTYFPMWTRHEWVKTESNYQMGDGSQVRLGYTFESYISQRVRSATNVVT